MSLVPPFIRRRLAYRPNLVKILDNISWLFLDKVLRMGVGLLVGVWIARYLGPEQFGLLNFALAFTGLFAAISGMGLQGIVVRDIVRDQQGAPLTLGTAGVLMLIGGLASYLMILAAIAYLRPDDPLARSIVAILGAIQLFKASEIAVYWFESQVQSKYTVWVQNGVFLVFAAVKVGLIFSHASLTAFVWATLAEAAVVAAILLVVLGWRGPHFQVMRASISRAKILLNDAWPLMLSGIAVLIYMRIDQIMLGQMIGDEAVGIYSAAVRISEMWYLVPMVMVSSVFPSLDALHKTNRSLFFVRLQKLCSLLVKTAIIVAILVGSLSDALIRNIYGERYQESSGVLLWHICGSVFVFFGVAWSRWMLLEGMQLVSTVMQIMSLLSNIALNFILIPKYGAVGAAVATTISYSMGHVIFMPLFKSQKMATKMFWRSFWVMR